MNIHKWMIKVFIAAILMTGISGCIFFDTEEPTINITSHNDGDTVGSTFILSGTASDNLGLKSVKYRVDTGDYSPVDGKESWNVVMSITSDGLHYITIMATDDNNNDGYAYLELTVDSDYVAE